MSATPRPAYVAVLAMLLGVLAGCSSDEPDDPEARVPLPTPSLTSTPAAPTPAPTPAPTSPEALVEQVLVTDADLLDGGRVETRADGTGVDGLVTLDNCGFVFRSEENRVARRQVNMSSVGADAFSHEVVAYIDEAAARDAIDELRESVRTCPSGEPVSSTLSPVPRVYEVLEFEERARGYPVDDVAVVFERVSTEDYPTYYSVAIFQRAGSVLNVLYLGGVEPPTPRLREEQRRQAMVTGTRLADVAGTATET